MTGPIVTSLCERIGCRQVGIMGGLIGALGTLLGSFSTDIYKMYLTQGFLLGVGASMCYFPSIVILPQYFSKRLSLVNGLVSCGSGLGTMVMGPVMNIIISNYGWRNCIRTTTMFLVLVSFISLLYRPLLPPLSTQTRDERPLFDFTVFQNRAFCIFTFALFFFMLVYFVPFVHLVSFY